MDPSQIDQMLVNLCLNSRDAIQGVGRITIETRNVTLDPLTCSDSYDAVPGEYATIVVSDDGCGMSKKELDHIFEPFFTTKEIGKGTGLGLATTYGIIRQNNGFIQVGSEPGHGTTIKLYIPRHEGAETVAGLRREIQDAHGQRETILVVEDEKAIMEMVVELESPHIFV